MLHAVTEPLHLDDESDSDPDEPRTTSDDRRSLSLLVFTSSPFSFANTAAVHKHCLAYASFSSAPLAVADLAFAESSGAESVSMCGADVAPSDSGAESSPAGADSAWDDSSAAGDEPACADGDVLGSRLCGSFGEGECSSARAIRHSAMRSQT